MDLPNTLNQKGSITSILSRKREDHHKRNKFIISFLVYLFCTLNLAAFGLTLISINNKVKAVQSCPLPASPTVINSQIVLNPAGGDGIIDCSAIDVIVGPTGELIIGRHVTENGNIAGDYGVTLLVNNITVQPGGKINADGQGYSNAEYESGTGRPAVSIANTGGAGAGHGGGGGLGIEEVGKPSPLAGTTYGQIENPITFGTAGGNVATDFLTSQKVWTSNADFNGGSYSNGMLHPASGNELRVKPADESLGNGADGAVTFSSDSNLNLLNTNGRSCADGGDSVNYNASALTATTATLTSTPSSGCLSIGDEILLINLQGGSGNTTNVGNYETLRISSVAGSIITFDRSKSKNYGSGANDSDIGTSASQQRVMIQRIPNYTDVTINSGVNLTINGWDGTKGGVMYFKSNGTLNLIGTINLTGKGYRGGYGYGNGGQVYTQGESYTGLGGAATAANAGGGGVGTAEGEVYNSTSSSGGGGGSYGSNGDDGVQASLTTQGAHGNTYGSANLSKLFLGSGGGGGGAVNYGAGGGTFGGNGGNGGGISFVSASTFNASGYINNNGSAGQDGNSNGGYGAAAGGGGAGGSTYIVGSGVTLGSANIYATGGAKGNGGPGGEAGTDGGKGGDGRIAVGYQSVSGNTSPVSTNSLVSFNLVSGEQNWISGTYDAGVGVNYTINKLTSNWVLDSDAIQPKFQILASNTGSFSGEEAIYPSGSDTYYQHGGIYNIDNGVIKNTTSEISGYFRYWKVKVYIDAGATLSDTPRILDVTLDAKTNGTQIATGGAGGGALKLVVTGTLTNNGTISADGLSGSSNGTTSGGGGSGGSIWIESDSLTGSGTIHANGSSSAAATYRGGGGGGGRMIVFCNTSNTYGGTATVTGGVVPGAQNGGVGSILGPTCRPRIPTVLTQYKTNNTTNVAVGGVTTENAIVLGSDLSDPDSTDLLSLQVEVKPLGTAFLNIPNFTQSSALANPQACLSPLSDCGKVTATSLSLSTEYHWQARVKDNRGGISNWVSFGANLENNRDFVVSGPARNISLTSGNSQIGTVFTSLVSPLSVTVTDINGFPVPGYGVSWYVVSGQNGGLLTDPVTYTNDSGVATNTYKLGRTSGVNSVQATGSGLIGGPVSFNSTGNVDVIHHFTVQSPQVALTNGTFDSVTIKAYDQYNNVKTDYAGSPNLTAVQALDSNSAASGILTPNSVTFSPSDNGVLVVSNISYNTHESIKLKVADGSSIGLSSTVAIVDTLGACPDADGIIDSNQTWNATADNIGIFDCSGLDIHVTSGATLTLVSFDNGDSDWTNDYGVTILADNLLVDSGSTISADASGYATLRGPGAGGGAAYGGFGSATGAAYGSVYEPSQLGSAGNGPNGAGGAIRLTITSLTQINGTLSSNAGAGTGCHQGGGTGGSIWIDTNVIKGSGLIRTNGAGGICNGGGGAGGRIAVYYTTNGNGSGGDNAFLLNSTSHIQSYAGNGDWCGVICAAGAGTIYVEQKGIDTLHEGRLYIDNQNLPTTAAALSEANYVFKEINLKRSGNLTIQGTQSNLTIIDGSALTGDSTKPNLNVEGTFNAPTTLNLNGVDVNIKGEISLGGDNSTSTLNIGSTSAAGVTLYGNTWAHSNGTYILGNIAVGAYGSLRMSSYDNGDTNYTNDNGVDLFATNLTIQSGGTVTANALGYVADRGLGTANGAAYGGFGGYGQNAVYGSVYEPHELGSGGSGGSVGPAGGAIKITVSNLTQIDGNLSSNASNAAGCHAGGGSGGAIWLDTNILKGSGLISSNGGNGACAGSGGSGGRIAIYYSTNGDGMGGDNTFALTDRNHIQAIGGNADWYGAPYHGGAGTVYVENKGVDTFHQGRLYVDNVNSTYSTAALVVGNYSFKEINLTRYGHLEVLGNSSELRILNGNDLSGDNTRPNLTVDGIFYGPSDLNINGVTLTIKGDINLGADTPTSNITIGSSVEGGLSLFGNTWAHTDGTYTFGDINVATKGLVLFNGYDNGDTNYTNDKGVILNADNLTVQSGGVLNATGLGYRDSGRGPGGAGGGASYAASSIASTTIYGSVYSPNDFGSASTVGGGGLIKLNIDDTAIVNGVITSNGLSGPGCHQGGASGGSINLNTTILKGNGTFSVNGGSGACAGLGGSGGRVAIYYSQNGDGLGGDNPFPLNDTTHLQSIGGQADWNGAAYNAGPGTIYIEHKGVDLSQQGTLLIDNANLQGQPSTLQQGDYNFKAIKLTRAGNLVIAGINSELNITDNSTLSGDNTKPYLNVEGIVLAPTSLTISGVTLGIKGDYLFGSDNSTSNVTIGGSNLGGLSLYGSTWAHVSGNYTFGIVNVSSNGTFTFNGNDNGDTNWTNDNGVKINLTTINIASGGKVTADLLGYTTTHGPGYAGVDGSYGGRTYYGASAYGSVYLPTDLGTGNNRISGGGAIRINASNEINNNGLITANGGTGPSGCQGGSSGGSILLETHIITGSGVISSDGGYGICGYGGGGGGRVAVYYNQNGDGLGSNIVDPTNNTKVHAFGGLADVNPIYYGGAGTIYFENKTVDTANQGSLYVDNRAASANAAVLLSGNYNFKLIRLSNGGNLDVAGDSSNLTVTDNNSIAGDSTRPNLEVYGTLHTQQSLTVSGVTLGLRGEIELGSDNTTSTLNIGGASEGGLNLYGHTWAHPVGSYNLGDLNINSNGKVTLFGYDNGDTNYTNDNGVTLNVTNINLASSGNINADLKGYSANHGPGNLATDASHGGRTTYGPDTYGSYSRPTELGSGSNGTFGGGAVAINANNNFILNGTISANGGTGPSGCQGGSSGGSILINTNNLTGNGLLRANGGASLCGYGGGGGGRIAIIYTRNGDEVGSNAFDWTNINRAQALGGPSLEYCATCAGGPGTVYAEDKTLFAEGKGDLRIANNGNPVTERGTDLFPIDYNLNSIYIGPNVKVYAKGDLSVTTEGTAFPTYTSLGTLLPGVSILGNWHLDEQYGAGNYLKNTINGQPDLSPVNSSSISGMMGNGRNSSNNGNSLLLSSPITLPTSWSVSTWLQFPLPTSLDGWRTVSAHLGGTYHHIIISIDGKLGSYNAAFFDSGFDVDSLSSGWHNIIAVGEGGSTKFYVDGNLVGTIASQAGSDIGVFCNYNSPGQQQCGNIDETTVFGSALTSGQVSTLYNYYQGARTGFNSDYADAQSHVVGRGPVLNLTGGFTLDTGAMIDGRLQGFGSNQGPGRGVSGAGNSGGGGGAYGGSGGSGQTDGGNPSPAGGNSYGSQRAPLNLGSGGGTSGPGTAGGIGGGAVAIRARYGNVVIASGASINVSGEVGHVASPGGGGGAGGSILIEGATCTIDGNLIASGGNGGNSTFDGGGGSGGRISILYSVGPCDTNGTVSVAEGSSVQAQSGQVGTSPAITSIPAVPTIKQQFESDASTIIPAGGTTVEQDVVLKANVSDPGASAMDPKHLRAEFQIIPFGDSFSASSLSSIEEDLSTASLEHTDLTYTGGAPILAQVPVSGLIKGQAYKWRTRIVNTDDNIASDWVNFNNSLSVAAFTISSVDSVSAIVSNNNPTAGTPVSVTVTARDSFGNPDATYRGIIHFTSNSGSAILPADYQFGSSDNGVHTFTDAITFIEPGSFNVTITDTVNGTLTFTTSTPIVVAEAPAPSTTTGGTTGSEPVSQPVSSPITPETCVTNPSALVCLQNVEISNVIFKKIDETTIQIFWTTNIPTKGYVDYGLASEGVYTDSTPVENSYSTSHIVTISNLIPGEIYSFRIHSVAQSSKVSTQQYSYSIATEEVGGAGETTDFIQISDKPYAFNSNQQAIIKFVTVQDAICKTDYGLDSNNLEFSSEVSDGTSHANTIDLNNADGIRDINYRVSCQSASTQKSYSVTGIIPASQYRQYLVKVSETTTSSNALTTFATVVSPLTLTLSIGLIALLNLLIYPRLILFILGLIRDPKKYSPWGIIHDSITKKPVLFATVRIYSIVDGKKTFIKEKITNLHGKYGLPVSKGNYIIEVRHPDYSDYSSKVTIESAEQNIAKDIGLTTKRLTNLIKENELKSIIKKYLAKINRLIIVVGFLIAIVSAVIAPVFINIAMVVLYLAQFIILSQISKVPRSWGYIYNSNINKRIQGGFIRVFSEKEGRQIDVQMSDEAGRFGFDLEEGDYNVSVSASGFKFPATDAKGEYKKGVDGAEYLKISLKKNASLDEVIPLDESKDISKPTEGFGS